METYPSTRHSANAMQQLRDLGYDVDVEVLEEHKEDEDEEENKLVNDQDDQNGQLD